MIAADEIQLIMGVGELALREKERRISGQRLVQQINRLQQIRPTNGAETCRKNEILGATVEIERSHIRRRRLFDGSFFTRRKLRLQLIRNRLGDLALNGEDVGQITIVSLSP